MPHVTAVKNVVKYLPAAKNYILILDPQKTRSLEAYVDSGLSGNRYNTTATKDVSTTKLRTGYASIYVVYLIIWASKLQTQIALSTTEAKYMAL